MARIYAEEVATKRLPACRYVQWACRRYLDMLDKANSGKARYYFSTEWAVDVCDFAEKIPHLEGVWDDEFIVLEPCQCFWLIAIFGFRRKANGHRLVSHVYMEIPRKSGKSLIVAIITLYCFACEGEKGSQVYIGAPKDEQAEKVYGPIKAIVDREHELRDCFNLKTTLKKISKEEDHLAFIKKISSKAETEDGHNPHIVVMEELHAQQPELYEVMESGTGARANLLFLSIGTAGRLAAGVGWEERKKLIAVLQGLEPLDHWFGVIYTLDEEDYENEENLFKLEMIQKANPMYGVSILPERVQEFMANSRGNQSKMIEVKRTRFNIWSGAAGDLINLNDWLACADEGLTAAHFAGEQAWIGADLSSKNDITAVVLMIPKDGRVYTFEEYFLPEETRALGKDTVGNMYRAWLETGHLTATLGQIVDYDFVEQTIRDWCEIYDVQAIVFDSYQSNQILSSLYKDGLPAMQMQPGTKNISDPTKDLIAHIEAKALVHKGNPVTEWMSQNVKGYYDLRDNVLPKKESKDSDYKIDGIAAMVLANAARLDAELEVKKPWRSIYEKRGLLGGEEKTDG